MYYIDGTKLGMSLPSTNQILKALLSWRTTPSQLELVLIFLSSWEKKVTSTQRLPKKNSLLSSNWRLLQVKLLLEKWWHLLGGTNHKVAIIRIWSISSLTVDITLDRHVGSSFSYSSILFLSFNLQKSVGLMPFYTSDSLIEYPAHVINLNYILALTNITLERPQRRTSSLVLAVSLGLGFQWTSSLICILVRVYYYAGGSGLLLKNCPFCLIVWVTLCYSVVSDLIQGDFLPLYSHCFRLWGAVYLQVQGSTV